MSSFEIVLAKSKKSVDVVFPVCCRKYCSYGRLISCLKEYPGWLSVKLLLSMLSSEIYRVYIALPFWPTSLPRNRLSTISAK